MRARLSQLGVGSIIAMIAVIGVIALGLFLNHERDREVGMWREKLDLIADARAREVTGFVQGQFRELGALTNNASLQIYFTKMQGSDAAAADGQSQYLRNLLTLTAQRLGFEAESATIQQQLGANVRALGSGGLALVDGNGAMLMATDNMPPIEGTLAEQVKAAPRGEASLIDITKTEEGAQRIGFVVPIYSIQAEQNAASQIGSLVGIRTLGTTLSNLMAAEATAEKTLEVALVRAEGNQVRYLTPLRDGSAIMTRTEAKDDASAAAYALAHAGEFAEKTDYRGNAVLMSARSITGTPWALIAKIDRAEALADAATWRNTVAATIVMLLIALGASIIAVWRHASAREQAVIAAESNARAQLLSVVTDNQQEQLFMVDAAMKLWFANQRAATAMGLPAADIRGKALANAVGPAYAQSVSGMCAQALADNTVQTGMITRSDGTIERSIFMRCIPLAHIPVAQVPYPTAGVLIVEQDMTGIIREREMRMNTLNQLVAMLVSLVDKRDPNAAEHSARVAELATQTATNMGLDARMVETTAIAARLMNLGKVDIPTELLTRDGQLNQAERAAIRSSLSTSADLLRGIAFDGPVAETLQQAQEHVDGTGPLNMKGEQILVSARIIAAANAVVGMRSPRAYRPVMAWDEVIRILQSDADTHFDRKVISAIMHYLDNHGGREKLERDAA